LADHHNLLYVPFNFILKKQIISLSCQKLFNLLKSFKNRQNEPLLVFKSGGAVMLAFQKRVVLWKHVWRFGKPAQSTLTGFQVFGAASRNLLPDRRGGFELASFGIF
jgi:hypothetical protein